MSEKNELTIVEPIDKEEIKNQSLLSQFILRIIRQRTKTKRSDRRVGNISVLGK